MREPAGGPGHRRDDEVLFLSHLLWIPAGAALGFGAAFLLGDLLTLPVDLYYLIYFALVLGFLALYARRTGLDARTWFSRRLAWGIVLGCSVACS